MLTLQPLASCLGIRNQMWTRIYGVWKSQIWNPEFLENVRRLKNFQYLTFLRKCTLEPTVTRGSFSWMFSVSEMRIWITHTKITNLNKNLDKSLDFHRKLQDFNDNLYKYIVFQKNIKDLSKTLENHCVFQRKTDIGEEPKRYKNQSEEPQGCSEFSKAVFSLDVFSTF